MLCVFCISQVSAKGKNKKAKGADANLTPLMVAAANCKLDEVTALLDQGTDVKALDGLGRDALTFAAAERTKFYALKCPDVVTALTKAGAAPWAARFYQNPEFAQLKPTKIAVLRVEDIRATKDHEETKMLERFVDGVEGALSQRIPRIAPVIASHYPTMKLSETRQRLITAGFSEEDVIRPDRKRACAAVGTDAVFEAVLKDYARLDAGIIVAHGAGLEFWLTDCRTGDLLWRNDPGAIAEAHGFFLRGINTFRVLCEQAVTFPRYDSKK
jgi:hypothetical protein